MDKLKFSRGIPMEIPIFFKCEYNYILRYYSFYVESSLLFERGQLKLIGNFVYPYEIRNFNFKWKGVFTSIMLFRIFVNYKSLVNLFFIFYSILQLNFKNVDRLRPTKVYQPPMSDCNRNWNRGIFKNFVLNLY